MQKRAVRTPKVYAVAAGHEVGIYDTWEECKARVYGCAGARYKSFKSVVEAQAFLVEILKGSAEATAGGKRKDNARTRGGGGGGDPDGARPSAGRKRSREAAFGVTRTEDEDEEKQSIAARRRQRFTIEDAEILAQRRELEMNARTSFVREYLESGRSPYYALLCEKQHLDPSPPADPKKDKNVAVEDGSLYVFTAGATRRTGKRGSQAGYGVWYGRGSEYNVSKPLEGQVHTNQRAELRAIVCALEDIIFKYRFRCPVVVNTNSQYCINCVGSWLRKWKENGWRLADGGRVMNRFFIKRLDDLMMIHRDHGFDVRFAMAKGHNSTGSEGADALARAAALL